MQLELCVFLHFFVEDNLMAINEVFPNPTVKGVHFEIRFPNLFYMEKKIGDLQMKIMKKFPKSNLILQRQVLLTDIGPESKIKELPDGLDSEAVKKIWKFESGTGMEVNVLNNSLSIHSTQHKTYSNQASDEKFRDLIEYVVTSFLEVIAIPIITRIGLRYIDECPIVKKDNKTFQEWYKTTFPLERFNLSDATEMNFRATVKKDKYFVRYIEALKAKNEVYTLSFDFDAFAEEIEPQNYLTVTDGLHTLISGEYEASIKDPVYKFMRQPS